MRLQGIWPALATPLNEDETVDEAGSQEALDRDAPVDVGVLGATGHQAGDDQQSDA